MIEEKKTDVVDDFIIKVRSHRKYIAAVQTDPMWAQRIDNLETVLRALFVSDDGRAIEMSDEVRRVIGRKRETLEKRIILLEQILREGGIHVFPNTVRT